MYYPGGITPGKNNYMSVDYYDGRIGIGSDSKNGYYSFFYKSPDDLKNIVSRVKGLNDIEMGLKKIFDDWLASMSLITFETYFNRL